MSAPRSVLVVATLLALAAVAPLAPAAGGAAGPEAEFVRAVPNPVAPEDRGESVTLSAPPDTDLGRFALDDGERRIALPNRTVGGRVTLTADPATVRNRTGAADAGTVVRTPLPALANGGEELRLLVDGVVEIGRASCRERV